MVNDHIKASYGRVKVEDRDTVGLRIISVLCLMGLLLLCVSAQRVLSNDINHFDPKNTVDYIDEWNNKSPERLLGCDICKSGDTTCSMGSSLAQMSRDDCAPECSFETNYVNWSKCCNSLNLPCCSDPKNRCGYIYKTVDYYGYFDVDDMKAVLNPLYKRYDGVYDFKFDLESGIPDRAVVDASIKSIKTTIAAKFVRESEWRGPPYWLHVYDQGPWSDWPDAQIWVMPCGEQNMYVQYYCRWKECRQTKVNSNPDGASGCCASMTCTSAGDFPCTDTETRNCPACDGTNGGSIDCGGCNGACGSSCQVLTPRTCTCSNGWFYPPLGPKPPYGSYESDNNIRYCNSTTVPEAMFSGFCANCDDANDVNNVDGCWCGWGCDIVNNSATTNDTIHQIPGVSNWCRPGGAIIPDGAIQNTQQKFIYASPIINDTYADSTHACDPFNSSIILPGCRGYPIRGPTGEDGNDDIMSADQVQRLGVDLWPQLGRITIATGLYGTMPDVLRWQNLRVNPPMPFYNPGLPNDFRMEDDDLVRDRYWKRNATDMEFTFSRPGYCSYEGCAANNLMTVPLGAWDGRYLWNDTRDLLDRPASRQHDPCRTCLEQESFAGCMANACFNYDLRYYRQINLDSMWANIFKINPEVNFPYMANNRVPDVSSDQCAIPRSGVDECRLGDVGDSCSEDDTSIDYNDPPQYAICQSPKTCCISGLVCTESGWFTGNYCCPKGSHYAEGCCRDDTTNVCSNLKEGCPPSEVTKKLQGTGEPCAGDSDCANYTDIVKNKPVVTEQHCSSTSTMLVSPPWWLHIMTWGGNMQFLTEEARPSYCCPVGFDYDLTARCCLPHNVAIPIVEKYERVRARMSFTNWIPGLGPFMTLLTRIFPNYGEFGYCDFRSLIDPGNPCQRGEGACRLKDTSGNLLLPDDDAYECIQGDNPTLCTKSVHSLSDLETGCCFPGEEWNGKACVALSDLERTPWYLTWTRTGNNTIPDEYKEFIKAQTGGGPIIIYSAGGATIPNGSEAAGWGVNCSTGDAGCEDGRYQAGYKRLLGNVLHSPVMQAGTMDFTKWPALKCSSEANKLMGQYFQGSSEYCFYCEGAWPYKVPPSPVWFEARNFGNNYNWENYTYACNGPYTGFDATIIPFQAYGPVLDQYPDLDCVGGKNCNCGRSMRGNGEPVYGPIDDRNPLLTDDGQSCPADGKTISIENRRCNNTFPTSSCIRSERGVQMDDDTYQRTLHMCDQRPRGHGDFYYGSPMGYLPNGTAVSPIGPSWDATDITPPICGQIQRKDVINTADQYYPRYSGDTPDSWFDYVIREYDKDRNLLRVTDYSEIEKGLRSNVEPSPPKPWTILNDNMLSHWLLDATRYFNISMNYTAHNEIHRDLYAQQCTWIGCSRLEEDVIGHYYKYIPDGILVSCDGGVPTVAGNTDPGFLEFESGTTPPCDCQEHCFVDASGQCVSEEDSPEYTWTCGGVTGRYKRYKNGCGCDFHCWGCWHLNGMTTTYPVTDMNDNVVYENISETSTVSALTYGKHLRTEDNLLTNNNPEIHMKLNGSIAYGYSSDTNAEAYASGYMTMKVYANIMTYGSSRPLDTFGGFEMQVGGPGTAIPARVLERFSPRHYPALHDTTALESTLPLDYLRLIAPYNDVSDPRLPFLLNLSTRVYEPGMIWGYNLVPSQSPLYLRWLRNPAKKFLYYSDMFTGYGTRYSWAMPIVLVDADKSMNLNYFHNPSDLDDAYRNYYEDEPRFYDYLSVSSIPVNIEQSIEKSNYLPQAIGNVEETRYSKWIDGINVRYAPDCKNQLAVSQTITMQCNGDDISNCPDMCSDTAEVYCNSGTCDCKYLHGYEDILPINSETACKDLQGTVLMQPMNCEGSPSKYKSYCADGMYWAYWKDVFSFKYQADGSGKCALTYLKTCAPRPVEPDTYTLFIDSSTLLKEDWDNTLLTMYSNLRGLTFNPFGTKSPCDEPIHVIDTPGLTSVMYKVHPKRLQLTGESVGEGESTVVRVEAIDLCTNSPVSDPNFGKDPYTGQKKIYVKFEYPYADYSDWFQNGDTVDITVTSNDIVAQMQLYDWADPTWTSIVPVKRKTPMCDYLMNNIWFVFVAYAALMAYRFFSGRVTDFQDMWDEFQGKK